MAKKRIMLILILVVACLAVWVLAAADTTVKKTEKMKIRVGIFDSRAVKLAYDTAVFSGQMPDIKVPKPIEFRQGFGRGDVSEYLDQIRDEIPKIAQKAGVDVIVSKWDIEYHNPNVTFIDVTEALIQPFKPTDERLKIIRNVMAKPPLTEKKIRELEASGKEI